MRQLSAKARAGTLTAEDDEAARRYELIVHLLNIGAVKGPMIAQEAERRWGKKAGSELEHAWNRCKN